MVGGRPRSTECDEAILDATLGEYAQKGLDGLSVDAVAARAGVSKATIYRRYPSKNDLVLAAARSICETAPRPDLGSLRADLTATLQNLRAMLEDPVLGAVKRTLLVDAARDEELGATHSELVRARRESTFAIFERAIARGEVQPDIDIEFAADLVGAPVFYRHLVMHEPVTDDYIARVVDAVVTRYGIKQFL
jgi:AcrR family transcriptional regulator